MYHSKYFVFLSRPEIQFIRYTHQVPIGIKWPNVCQEKIPNTITPPACTVDTRQDGAMDSYCLHQTLTLPSAWRNRNRGLSDQTMFYYLSNVQCWWCPVEPLLLVFSWQEWNPVWSSATIALPLQGPMSCAFRDAILYTTDVLRRDFAVGGSPVNLYDSCHSPLTSLINELFSPTGLPLTGCFVFLSPFSVYHRHCRAWKAQSAGCFWDTGTGLPGTDDYTMSLRSLVLPILKFNQTLTEYLNVCLAALYSKPRTLDYIFYFYFTFI